MNFFAAQERARKSTRMLVLWFSLCVVGVIASMYLVTSVARNYVERSDRHNFAMNGPKAIQWWDPEWLLGNVVIVGGIILCGSLYRLSQLSGGGNGVAQKMGGRPISLSTQDPDERRLLNVVEEMSIASGVPMPNVWIMDEEESVNAFAAGTDPANAVICVTRGTIERLTRQELQGVVAHEFSHILNGDMKLNMRLMGWIFGLVMISMLGRLMIQAIRLQRGSRNSKGGGLILAIILTGAAVWCIGSIGVFFARILQAAISREREFLADASAVQFTRDPNGISDALKKIGGFWRRGQITSPNAAEARHLFFAASSFNSWFATHPPLEQRIKAIDPTWDGKMIENTKGPTENRMPEMAGAMGFAGAGEISNAPVAQATSSSKQEAMSLIFGLLIPAEAAAQQLGSEILQSHGFDNDLINLVLQKSTEYTHHPSSQKLVLIDKSLPWLRLMTPLEARNLIQATQSLIEADGQIDLFEFMLQQVIRRHVEIGLGLEPVPPIAYNRLWDLESDVATVLALFATLDENPDALDAARAEYREHTRRELPTLPADFSKVAIALGRMDASTPLVKQQILRLCSLVVLADGCVSDHEQELLRATAEAIGAPIPPMVRRAA